MIDISWKLFIVFKNYSLIIKGDDRIFYLPNADYPIL